MFGETAIATNYSRTRARDKARISENGSSDSFVELSSGFNLWKARPGQPPRNRVFVRWANRESETLDRIFGTNDDLRGWTISTGVSANVF
jgi:hypothetical protein